MHNVRWGRRWGRWSRPRGSSTPGDPPTPPTVDATITVPSDGTDQTAYIAAQIALIDDGADAQNPTVVQIENDNPVVGSRVDGRITLSNRHHLVFKAPLGETFTVWTDKTGIQARVQADHETDGAITATDNTLTSAGANFIASDVGKTISVSGAGAAGATLTTTIASRNSATSVELTVAASTTVTDAVIDWGDSTRDHVRISGGSTDVTLRGWKVVGPNTGRNGAWADYTARLEGEHAYFFTGDGTDGNIVENCRWENVHGDGVSSGSTGAGAENNIARSMTGSYCGRHGICVTTGSLTVEDSTITFCGRSWCDLESNTDTVFVPFVTLRRCSGSSNLYFISQTVADNLDATELIGDLIFDTLVQTAQGSSGREMFHCNGGGASLAITGCVSAVSTNASLCVNILSSWTGDVTITDSTLASDDEDSYGVEGGSGVAGSYTVRRNNFGRAVALASVTPDSHCGNTWATGSLNDGAC